MQPRPFFSWQALDPGDLIDLARPGVADLQAAHCPTSLSAGTFRLGKRYGVSGQLSHVAGPLFGTNLLRPVIERIRETRSTELT